MILKSISTEGENTTETLTGILQNSRGTKVKRLYEDDNWVIDKIGDNIRVSYFKNSHFVDEQLITPKTFEDDR